VPRALKQIVFGVLLLVLLGCSRDEVRGERDRESLMPAIDWTIESDEDLLSLVADRVEQRVEAVGFDRLLAVEKTVYCIWWLEAEVNNGGFHQFFFNTAGNFTVETVAALDTVGANNAKAILEQAAAVFAPGGPDTERYARQDQLEMLSEAEERRLNDLDARFYEYPDDLSKLLASYVRGNKEEFRP